MKSLTGIFVTAVLLMSSTGTARALSIDLTSGTTGTNAEIVWGTATKGVELVAQSDLLIGSMSVDHLNIAGASAILGARIYDARTPFDLIASADVSVPVGSDQSVTVPISANLVAGRNYSIGFFLDVGSGFAIKMTMFDPTPSGISATPYLDSTGSVSVPTVRTSIGDNRHITPNTYLPFISMQVVPIPPTAILLASGLIGLAGFARRRKQVQ